MNKRLSILVLAALLLGGCAGNPTSTPTLTAAAVPAACPTPEPGSAALCGQVRGAEKLWPDETVTVFAAPFTPDGKGNGFYFLEPVSHPHAPVGAGGGFQLTAVPPGEYVLIVGPEAGRASAWLGEDGRPRVVTAGEGEPVEVGVVEVR